MLKLDNACTTLGAQSWVFNANLAAGKRYAIFGRSGSGKSTLLNCIAGFLPLTSGDIKWNTTSLTPLPPNERPITTLFQQHNLFAHLTVADNIGLGINPALKLTTQDRAEVDEVLEKSGLGGFQQKRPPALSGGEQQRVALARCLLRKKPILLLDEPFSALDDETRATMINLLTKVIENINPCVLMVTHDETDASAIDARPLWLRDGRICPG